jgi:hypothetical protein
MTPVVAAAGPTALWYVARGSALTALVLLTVSTVLGIVTTVRWTNDRWPRFVIELLHRNSSLVAFALILVHVSAVVIDAFAPIGWKDTVIPFASGYRPVWLGLGAVAFDLLLAVLVTSLLRHRMSHRAWRAVHWSAYLAWPLVVVHGLATGSDTKLGAVLVLNVVCIAAVILTLWWRLAVGWPEHAGVRLAALGVSVVAPVVLVAWLASGPLAAGWARAAGTPDSILAKVAATPTTAAPAGTVPASGGAGTLPAAPFTAPLAGSLQQSAPGADGRVTVRLALSLGGTAHGALVVTLIGSPLEGGGVLLDTSTVTLGPPAQPARYQGKVVSLRGQRIVATVTASASPSLQLVIDVQTDASGNQVRGTVSASAGGGA